MVIVIEVSHSIDIDGQTILCSLANLSSDRQSIRQFTGEYVDGQTIGQLTGEFVDGQTSSQLTGEFVDGQTSDELTSESSVCGFCFSASAHHHHLSITIGPFTSPP